MSDLAGLSGAELIFRVLDPACSDRGAAGRYLLKNPPPPDCLTPTQKLQVQSFICSILSDDKMWMLSWDLCVCYASLVQTYCDGKTGSQLMLKALEKCDRPDACLQVFFHVRGYCFACNINLRPDLWTAYFWLYQKLFGASQLPRLKFIPLKKRAIILTSQMLRPPHQPTRNVSIWAKMLEQDFGYDVVVVNTYENPDHCDLPIIDPKFCQRLPQYHGCQTDAVQGIRVFTPTCDMPTIEGYTQICAFVQAWQPAFILNFGSMNFSGEYLGQFANVISMQAGTDLVPTHTSGHIVTLRPLRDADLQLLDKFRMSDIPRIRTTYCYGMPEISEKYHRADFDLTADDVVLAVVGSRLRMELTDSNLALLCKVLAQDARLRILFIGPMEDAARTRALKHLPQSQVRFAGFCPDVPSLFDNVCDAYLNPVRTGGGGSAAYALAVGLPVFTLNVGHVAANTHPDFVYPSEEALLAGVKRFAAGEGRAEAVAKARARFAEMSDRRMMLRDILAGAGLPTDLRAQAAE